MADELETLIDRPARSDFKRLFESAPGAFLVLDPGFTIVAASDEYLRRTMRKRREIIGRPLFDAFPDNPDDPTADGTTRLRASLERVLRQGETDVMPIQRYDIPRPARRGGGFEERWWRPVNAPVRGDDGNVRFLIHRVEDVTREQRLLREREDEAREYATSRVEWERELSRLAAQLFTTLESIDEGFFLVDEEWRFTHVNRRCEQLMGRSRGQLLGADLWEELPESPDSTFRRNCELAMSERRSVEFEAHSDPLSIWCEVRAYPSSGGLAVLFRDTTSRRENRARIEEQAAVIDQAQDAIVIGDLEHRIRFWNRSAERLYGYTREEAIGREMPVLLSEEPTRFARAARAVLAEGRWSGDLHQRKKDGTEVLTEGHWSLLRHGDGTPRAILAIHTDVTARKEMEAKLFQAQRIESIGRLAGGIAHDLNNVFTPILMSISLLGELVGENADAREILDLIHGSTLRGSDMVRQVLAFARGVEGRRHVLDLESIVFPLRRMLKDTFPKSIRFDVELAPGRWPVVGDATQIHQVLLNLCVNARDAMQGGRGTIRIRCRNVRLTEADAEGRVEARPGAYLRVSVADTGTGIPPDIMGRIFDPFFTTKEVGRGTGLGLPSVRAIVRSHGGWIEAHSKDGQGSTFDVFLPASPDGLVGQPAPEDEEIPQGRGELVLVVDDEAGVRAVTRRALEGAGYRALTAEDGRRAIELLAENLDDVALVITDMIMPGMDGGEVIDTLRELKPTLRAIAVSGVGTAASFDRANGAGVDLFLPKPFTAGTMLRLVRGILDDADPRAD